MHRSFVLALNDRPGSFLAQERLFAAHGLDIKRVSYNKVIDVHTLFIEAEGEEEALDAAEAELRERRVLAGQRLWGRVVLLEFELPDAEGALTPFLELCERYGFSLTYLNARAKDYHVGAALDALVSEPELPGAEIVRAGLYVEDPARLQVFLDEVQRICPCRQLPFGREGYLIDNTLFYEPFAKDISKICGFTEAQAKRVMVNANRLIQVLETTSADPFKPFDYMRQFAERIERYRGDGYAEAVRTTRFTVPGGAQCALIEPPCGSDTWILFGDEGPLFVDTGFAVYRDELAREIEALCPGWKPGEGTVLLSHGDADHSGAINLFAHALASEHVIENYARQREGRPDWRERDPRGLAYSRLANLFSRYEPPAAELFESLGKRPEGADEPIARCVDADGDPVTLDFAPFSFEVYEGKGGHVKGETVLIDRTQHLCVSGDILINIHGETRPQSEFNRLAPFLLTRVDAVPDLARAERKYLIRLLGPGVWQILGGHGAVLTRQP
jgi:glyoxylase-like metal-dependent hydrolase (beta-lactamase superfamily II)